jgi:hypothetical protein
MGNNPSLADIPIAILKDELQRRGHVVRADGNRDGNVTNCGSSGRGGSYNTPLHIAALVLILALSTLGMCSPPGGCNLFIQTHDRPFPLIMCALTISSMLISRNRSPISTSSNPATFSLSLTAFWNWRAYRNGVCPSSPDRICVFDQSMSAQFLA